MEQLVKPTAEKKHQTVVQTLSRVCMFRWEHRFSNKHGRQMAHRRSSSYLRGGITTIHNVTRICFDCSHDLQYMLWLAIRNVFAAGRSIHNTRWCPELNMSEWLISGWVCSPRTQTDLCADGSWRLPLTSAAARLWVVILGKKKQKNIVCPQLKKMNHWTSTVNCSLATHCYSFTNTKFGRAQLKPRPQQL